MRQRCRADRRRRSVRWSDLVRDDLFDALGDVVMTARPGAGGKQPPKTAGCFEQRRDRLTCELGHRHSAPLRFMAKACVELVGQSDGGPLHVCQHAKRAVPERSGRLPRPCRAVLPELVSRTAAASPARSRADQRDRRRPPGRARRSAAHVDVGSGDEDAFAQRGDRSGRHRTRRDGRRTIQDRGRCRARRATF